MPTLPSLRQTVLDGEDIRVLAEFYRQLLGLEYRPGDEVPMQLHLDCTVPDVPSLEENRDRALALGGRVVLDRSDDPEEPLYVIADPAGHPLCIFVG